MEFITAYPADKEIFPAFHEDAQEWRESTTFYGDFKIAEAFGEKAVKDTFSRAFSNWKNDAKYIVELCAVANHLCWEHYGKRISLSKVYDEFYHKCWNHIFKADENGNNSSSFTDNEQMMMYRVLD